jgi:hypothetical protein
MKHYVGNRLLQNKYVPRGTNTFYKSKGKFETQDTC